jgi:hypothetical protein
LFGNRHQAAAALWRLFWRSPDLADIILLFLLLPNIVPAFFSDLGDLESA